VLSLLLGPSAAAALVGIVWRICDVIKYYITSKLPPGSRTEVVGDSHTTRIPSSEIGWSFEEFFRETFKEILKECVFSWPVTDSQAEAWVNSAYFHIQRNWESCHTMDFRMLRRTVSETVAWTADQEFPPPRLLTTFSRISGSKYQQIVGRSSPDIQAERVRDATRYVTTRLSKKEREIFRSLFHGTSEEQIAQELQIKIGAIRSCERRILELFKEAWHENEINPSEPLEVQLELPVPKITSGKAGIQKSELRKWKKDTHEAPQSRPHTDERREHVEPH